jgi:hypothetical protein
MLNENTFLQKKLDKVWLGSGISNGKLPIAFKTKIHQILNVSRYEN